MSSGKYLHVVSDGPEPILSPCFARVRSVDYVKDRRPATPAGCNGFQTPEIYLGICALKGGRDSGRIASTRKKLADMFRKVDKSDKMARRKANRLIQAFWRIHDTVPTFAECLSNIEDGEIK